MQLNSNELNKNLLSTTTIMGACITAILWIIYPFIGLGILIKKCFLRLLASVFKRNNGESEPKRDDDGYGDHESKNLVKETSVDHGKIVIALDIGTEYMGFALSCQKRKNQIYTAKNSCSPQSNRMPTAVLLNDDLSLNSVGFAAVRNRSKLALLNLHSKDLYFRKSRLKVFEQEDIDCDYQGNVSSEKIVCHVMEALKRNALETTEHVLFREEEHTCTEENIEWILTAPKNLTKEAENIILRAAEKANLKLKRGNFVPESDAAARYCWRKHLKISRQNEITYMPEGHKFVVADLGAGKTSICVYEIFNGTLARKCHIAKNVGGNSVNEEFEKFMEMICGLSSWNEFRVNHVFDYEKLMHSFEEEKVKFDNDTECIVLPLPQTLLGNIKTIENVSLEERIEAHGELLDKAELIQEKLFICRKQMEKYFMQSLQLILDTLTRIREEFTVEDLSEMLLVGGYSVSAFIRKELKEKLPSFDIVLVQDPEMVVLKGAVLMGLEN